MRTKSNTSNPQSPGIAVPGLAALLALCLALPLLAVAWVSFSPDGFLSPPRNQWSLHWYREIPHESRWTGALPRSLIVALGSTLVSLTTGVPLAAAVARPGWRGRRMVSVFALLPLGVPAVAVGAGWLAITARLGIPPGLFPLIVAHGALGLPVVVLVVGSHLGQLDPGLSAAARSLGASPGQQFWRVTLPLALPGVVAAALACAVLSFNESVISVFLAAPGADTLPAVVWPSLRQGPTPFVAVAAVVSSTAGLAMALLLSLPQRRRRHVAPEVGLGQRHEQFGERPAPFPGTEPPHRIESPADDESRPGG